MLMNCKSTSAETGLSREVNITDVLRAEPLLRHLITSQLLTEVSGTYWPFRPHWPIQF